MATDTVTHTVYVTASRSLTVINGPAGKVTGTIQVPDVLGSVAVNSATDTVYAVGTNMMWVISGQTGKVTATIAGINSLGLIAVDPLTDTIYATDPGNDTVTVIDGHTNTVTATVAVGNSPAAVAVDPLTDTVYVASRPDDTISVIDGATNAVTATVSLGALIGPIAVDPLTDTVYAANWADHTIEVIDGATNTVTAAISNAAPDGMAVDPQTDTIYSVTGGGVAAYSGRTDRLVGVIFTGHQHDGATGADVAVDPASGTIYATYYVEEDDQLAYYLAVITSCGSHVLVSAGTGCAQLAAGFRPVAAGFGSPARGVVTGGAICGLPLCLATWPAAMVMATSDGGKRWAFLTPPPYPVSPRPSVSVVFTSPDNGWLSDWHTSDGGATWQQAGPPFAPVAMAASATTIYAVVRKTRGPAELFARPVDGTAWTQVAGVTAYYTGLAVSGHAVWLAGQRQLWATADGRHWRRYPSRCLGTGYHLAGVTAASPSHVAFLCTGPAGTRKEILTSSDGGRTVHLAGRAPASGAPEGFASPPGDPALITIAAAGTTKSSRTAWLYRSANGGRTWTTLTFRGNSQEGFSSLTYTTRTTAWIVLYDSLTSKGSLLRTTDSGRTWHQATP
jgi:YVTN family beta-propeller protein